MAENELANLSQYYLETDEFRRSRRGEVNVVVGRKGSGKTALFARLRDTIRNNKKNIVLDLKPQGYQLVKLKDRILDYLSEGSKSHLITAFWEYILYLELAYKILEKDRSVHMNNHDLYSIYNELYSAYHIGDHSEQGDFSERLQRISDALIDRFKSEGNSEIQLSNNEITELLYTHNIKSIKSVVSRYLTLKEESWILFDNLDKGWSTRGLSKSDILILRSLIDAARKVQRDLSKNDNDFYAVVFIRNDVYQLLVRSSADFGKESRAALDWSDADMLREMLRRRIVNTPGMDESQSFDDVWSSIFQSHIEGEESSQHIIERCLMRPRNFIKIVQLCRGAAINLGKNFVDEDAITKGLSNFSDDLLLDASRELIDINPTYENILYNFIDEESTYTLSDLEVILTSGGEDLIDYQQAVDHLLYYGFLGIKTETKDPEYIYHNAYDMKKFQARIKKRGAGIQYVLNPAFWPALGISN